jgi:hypothetical protein
VEITVGNDKFIGYVNDRFPNCKYNNSEIAREFYHWIVHEKKLVKEPRTQEQKGPKTYAKFTFDESIYPDIYDFLDTLGRAKAKS